MTVRTLVGIDLVTTHTVVAFTDAREPAAPRIFPIPELVTGSEVEAHELLPSFLYAPTQGEQVADPWRDAPWVIGELARRRGQEVPGRVVSSAKSWLCHGSVDRTAPILPWGVSTEASDVPRISPVDAAARVLSHVRRAWDAAFPDALLSDQQVVLTVPASFDQAARELTLRAAQQAGLAVRLLEEPQAAFYDFMQQSGQMEALGELLGGGEPEALVLVCDVGGGTTDLSLIKVTRDEQGALDVSRVAVGRHLLLGGDNMDLALAHLCEARLAEPPARLDPQRFGQLVLACRAAKERLLGDQPPDSVPIRLLGSGSALVGGTLSTDLSREEVERVVLDGFLPPAPRDARPGSRGRAGLVAFGLPYERDAAITRHVADFSGRYAPRAGGPRALLLNGGLFRARRLTERLIGVVQSWGNAALDVLPAPDPDLAVARGAVAYAAALAGHGPRIGGGAAHGYYIGLEGDGGGRAAVCVVPRGSQEGERHSAATRRLALKLGQPVRFELYASDDAAVHAPGQIVELDDEHFRPLPPVAAGFDVTESAQPEEVPVVLEGELSAIGTLELGCVEVDPAGEAPRHFRLAFELRSDQAKPSPEDRGNSPKSVGRRFDEAREAIERVFGKSRGDVRPREVKDLLRELERLLGERASWTGELTRALFDVLAPKKKARRRSADHERLFWMLAGYCLRPGYGHPLDPQRIRQIVPLEEQHLTFQQEARVWQQYWIAWRRIAGGLDEEVQVRLRNRIDPFLAPSELKLKKPKGFKPLAHDEMLEMVASLERVPAERRAELGRWLIERTWTDRNPRLWAAIGRIGARVPTYASVHHVVAPRTVERWVDHLLREKWEEMPSAPRAAMQLGRLTDDRVRDVSATLREEVAKRLEQSGAPPEWSQSVKHFVPVREHDRTEFFGEELPVGLRLAD